MTRLFRSLLALYLVVLVALPPLLAASPSTATVRGVLLTKDGLPAEGYQIGLKSAAGDLFLSAPTRADGSFAVELLPPGRYRLVAFAPDGAEFPVMSKEVRLRAGDVERVEVRVSGEPRVPGSADRAAAASEATKTGGGTRPWMIGVAIGGLFGLGLILASNDDGSSSPASPSTPPR